MKKGVIYYFSATGNTKLACEYIAGELKNSTMELRSIAHNSASALDRYDFVGFATFTEWLDPPMLMKRFIEALPQQEGKPAFLLNTCAGLSGRTLKTLHSLATRKGFKVVESFTLYAPESYPPMIAKGRTKENYPSESNLNRFRAWVTGLDILLAKDSVNMETKAPRIGIINSIMPRFSREKSKKAMGAKFVDKDLCNRCGNCERVCPHEAIWTYEGPVFEEEKCFGCWSCFNHCPQKAIYTKTLRERGHYRTTPAYRHKMESGTKST